MTARRPAPAPLTTDQEALLAAIVEHPDEDTPRLAYADLLDEIGGGSNRGRAEFIRLQVRLEAGGYDLPNRETLQAKADRLLKRHRREWEGAVRVEGGKGVEFRRGFVTDVSATADAFVRAGGRWLDEHPVRCVTLENVRGDIGRLAASPHLGRVRRLNLVDTFGESDLRGLADGPGAADRFAALETLYVGMSSEGDGFFWGGASALVAWHMPRLRTLCLTDLRDGDRAAAAVAGAPWFAGLASVHVWMSRIGDAGLAALLAPRTALSDVTLGYSRVSARGLLALADRPADPPLRNLCLWASRIFCEDRPLAPKWSLDPDRLSAVLHRHRALRIDLGQCPIPEGTRAELRERFGDRVEIRD
ncbi:MAG TPA: TIGR02996 domain-containing protein [Gemmata sp.]